MLHNDTCRWFYIPDLATWGRLHVFFSGNGAWSDGAQEMDILRTMLPDGAKPLAVDLGGNYIVEDPRGRITYFDSSGYHRRYEASLGSSVYPVAASIEAWTASLQAVAVPRPGSRAWRLDFADRQRKGGTRPEEMWYFPEQDKAQCIERAVFLRFCPAEYLA